MPPDTRENLLKAATQVFAEKGFSGARVDEIAALAKANKAMIYYHFGTKVDLYEATLLALFSKGLETLDAVEAKVSDPLERLSAFYRGLAELFIREPALPAIMAREALEGGRNVTPQTAGVFTRIISFVGAAVAAGVATGQMRPVHPMTLHLSVIGPLLLYFVGEGLRTRVVAAAGMKPLGQEAFLDHVDRILRRGLAPDPEGAALAARAGQESV